jgi:hypothetical protein
MSTAQWCVKISVISSHYISVLHPNLLVGSAPDNIQDNFASNFLVSIGIGSCLRTLHTIYLLGRCRCKLQINIPHW